MQNFKSITNKKRQMERNNKDKKKYKKKHKYKLQCKKNCPHLKKRNKKYRQSRRVVNSKENLKRLTESAEVEAKNSPYMML